MRRRSTLEVATQWATIVTAVVALALGGYSVWHGNQTLHEAEAARQLAEQARVEQAKPHLGFVLGKGALETLPPGVKDMIKVTALNYDKDSVSGAEGVGTLRNYGAGAALSISLEWTVDAVKGVDKTLLEERSRAIPDDDILERGTPRLASAGRIEGQRGQQGGCGGGYEVDRSLGPD